jgi:hypothetical protein
MTAPEATSVKAEGVNWAGVESVLDPVIDYDPAKPQALRRTVLLLTKQKEYLKFEEPVWPIWVPPPIARPPWPTSRSNGLMLPLKPARPLNGSPLSLGRLWER